MTNAEKYLKVSINDFFSAIIESQIDISGLYSLEKWLIDEAKPVLTEDERVILRNLPKEYKYIHRVKNKRWLELSSDENDNGHLAPFAYDHLFQFIKERRRIRNSRIAERRIND